MYSRGRGIIRGNGSPGVKHMPTFDTFAEDKPSENAGCLTDVFMIGIVGGTASGKTYLSKEIQRRLGRKHSHRIQIVSQDSFYRTVDPQQVDVLSYNFDSPEAFDFDEIVETLNLLKHRKTAVIPEYDHSTYGRKPDPTPADAFVDIVIFEGILAYFTPEIRKLLDLKIFVETDADTRLARRIERDTKCRGRDLQSVVKQYVTTVKPSFDQYTLPLKKFADIIFPNTIQTEDPEVIPPGMDVIIEHIRSKIMSRDFTCNQFRNFSDEQYSQSL